MMPDTALLMTISLERTFPVEEAARLQTWLDDCAAIGVKQLTIELDAVPRLDSPLIKMLIEISRRARERGTQVRLMTTHESIRTTLAVTGIGKLFPTVV
jgi:anti-anti-sigma factor